MPSLSAPLCKDTSKAEHAIGVLLSASMVDEMENLLVQNPDSWCTDSTCNMQKQARWVAERMVLHMYNIPKYGTIKSTYELDSNWLSTWHQQARVWRNEFLRLHPHLPAQPSTLEMRNICNPDGSVDFWQALMAANAYRFSLLDQFEFPEVTVY